MEENTLVTWATIGSPLLTLLLTAVGWILIFSDSKNTSARAEIYDLLSNMVNATLALNQRAAVHFLEGKHKPGTDRAWVASVSVEISSLRATAAILKEVHSIDVPDDFFYSVRKNHTLDAEGFSKYTAEQVIQKIALQNTQTSRTLKLVYELYPGKK